MPTQMECHTFRKMHNDNNTVSDNEYLKRFLARLMSLSQEPIVSLLSKDFQPLCSLNEVGTLFSSTEMQTPRRRTVSEFSSGTLSTIGVWSPRSRRIVQLLCSRLEKTSARRSHHRGSIRHPWQARRRCR